MPHESLHCYDAKTCFLFAIFLDVFDEYLKAKDLKLLCRILGSQYDL